MNNDEISKANRKALPKFILIMFISIIIGGLTGFYSAKYGLNNLSGRFENIGTFFGMYIAPWLMLAIAFIIPIPSVIIYQDAKKLLALWDGENEEISDKIDSMLSIVIYITSAALIFSYFLIAASYSNGFTTFDKNMVSFIVGIISFLAIMIESIIFQQKCIDAAKITNPEKNVSVYDTKFQKKWLENCDEAEKIMMGNCAFKAYSATNIVCTILSVVLAVCALIFDIGFLPSLVVCIVWIVNLSIYCIESIKFSKPGNKLS